MYIDIVGHMFDKTISCDIPDDEPLLSLVFRLRSGETSRANDYANNEFYSLVSVNGESRFRMRSQKIDEITTKIL